MDLDLLMLFVAVAESASFSAAAKKLGLPKSSVSRGVAALEAGLGTQLLHRTTRHVSLSTAGSALYERVAPLLAQIREAIGSLPEREEQPSGELRITAPNDVGAAFLADLIARFTARHPAVTVDARLTNRNVDLVAEGFDLALRAAAKPLKDSSLVGRKVAAIELHYFASPTYLARRGTPRTIEEAIDHDWVAFRGLREIEAVQKKIIADDFFFVLEAVRSGAGVGLLPSFLGQAHLSSGALVRVLPRVSHPGGHLVLLYPKSRHVPRKVIAFRDFLLETLLR